MPILLSSPTIRGAPQRGLATDIRRMRSRTSFATVGRPEFPDLVSLAQRSRNLRRRHAMTVRGCTMNTASRHPYQIRDSHAQRSRPPGSRRGHFAERRYTAS